LARAPELYTPLLIFNVMTRSDDETIVPETHVFCMEEAIVSLSDLCIAQRAYVHDLST
jgi:hypothetical protein